MAFFCMIFNIEKIAKNPTGRSKLPKIVSNKLLLFDTDVPFQNHEQQNKLFS